MRLSRLIAPLFFGFAVAVASADPVTVTGVEDNSYGGIYTIGGQNYWWMCIEPGTPALNSTITADQLSVLNAWDRQNTERLNFYTANPGYYGTSIPLQTTIMTYVLDSYLPWSTLAGASGRFIEQNTGSANYDNDEAFYNAFFAVQNFLAETAGKPAKEVFTDLSDYMDYYNGINANRSDIFQDILTDVAGKAGTSFFDAYTAQHGYFVVNTLLPTADPDNWQDGLVIGSFAPVPEPGSAFLIASCGLGWTLRRRRK